MMFEGKKAAGGVGLSGLLRRSKAKVGDVKQKFTQSKVAVNADRLWPGYNKRQGQRETNRQREDLEQQAMAKHERRSNDQRLSADKRLQAYNDLQALKEERESRKKSSKGEGGGVKLPNISKVGGMAKAAAGFGAGFLLGRNKPGQVTGEIAASSIFLAIVVDIIAAVTFATGGNILFVLIAHIFLFMQFRGRLGADPLLNLAFVLNIIPIVLVSSWLTGGYDLLQNKFLMVTVGNGIFPIWTIFAGFVRNPQHSWPQKIVFWAFLIGALGWAGSTGYVADSYADVQAASPEQIKFATDIWVNLGKGIGTVVGGGVDTLLSIPTALGASLSSQIASAGGEELYGEPKERVKLGIEIKSHPYGFKEVGDKKIAKAILLVPNLPDENFLEISNVTCSTDDDTVQPNELKTRLGEGEKIKIFYNNPMTVTCTFTEDHNNFEDISSITLTVKYDFKENAKLITYLMRDDLKTELLLRGEDPLDFMAVPSNKRRPTTVYDNGPARIGIGPIELTNPPFGIGPNLEYSPFELVIGNKPDFGGEISLIKNISITLPDGINLDTELCIVTRDGDSQLYTLSDEYVAKQGEELTGIKSSRYFTCGWSISNTALGNASFAEVEFDVTIDFTYETDKKIRLTKNT